MSDLPQGWVAAIIAGAGAASGAVSTALGFGIIIGKERSDRRQLITDIAELKKRVDAHDGLESVMERAIAAMEQQNVKTEAALERLAQSLAHSNEMTNLKLEHIIDRLNQAEAAADRRAAP